jgi:hypothetical protein
VLIGGETFLALPPRRLADEPVRSFGRFADESLVRLHNAGDGRRLGTLGSRQEPMPPTNGCSKKSKAPRFMTDNATVLPQSKTGRPHPKAIIAWAVINAVLYSAIASVSASAVQAYAGLAMAGLHFIIVVSALLVIAEENGVWAAYVRFVALAAPCGLAIARTTAS